ncbi:hypothetical protein ACR9YC_07060 [Parasphingorhabdus sp. DH2-15]|uniref:hypothetical protein n=1 Tax=Parasphingorhabdus sp. DH2-15 TaxID=3444112 RepID=UPI003F68270D
MSLIMPNLRRLPLYALSMLITLGAGSTSAIALAKSPEAATSAQQDIAVQPLHFVEFQWVNHDTSSIDEARSFISWARTVAARHNVDLQVNVMVTGIAKGGAGAQIPDFIFVYTFPSQQSMTAMQTDPEYQARLPERNRIFDFSRNTIWRVERMK